MIEDLAKLPLEFSPGEAWNYSVSTDVLGYLVGKISGKPFEQFLKERIFDPLGMVDTDFYVPADEGASLRRLLSTADPARDGKACCRTIRPRAPYPRAAGPSSPAAAACARPQPTISPSAARCSTAASSAASRLLGPKTLELMTTNHLPGGVDLTELSRSLFSEATYDGVGFGLGFAVTMDPARDADPRQRRRILLGRRGHDRRSGSIRRKS